ncbi:MAG: pseudouridine synthase, partial [Frankiales bacterium]|nr:pseudouridine synthase [Frankiales bacterium]
MSSRRTVPVPEGLDGLRLDAAISRMFGLSRTAAADLVSKGAATLDGKPTAKSDRVSAGETLDLDLPVAEVTARAVPEEDEGLTVLYEDDDVIVVDKPVG